MSVTSHRSSKGYYWVDWPSLWTSLHFLHSGGVVCFTQTQLVASLQFSCFLLSLTMNKKIVSLVRPLFWLIYFLLVGLLVSWIYMSTSWIVHKNVLVSINWCHWQQQQNSHHRFLDPYFSWSVLFEADYFILLHHNSPCSMHFAEKAKITSINVNNVHDGAHRNSEIEGFQRSTWGLLCINEKLSLSSFHLCSCFGWSTSGNVCWKCKMALDCWKGVIMVYTEVGDHGIYSSVDKKRWSGPPPTYLASEEPGGWASFAAGDCVTAVYCVCSWWQRESGNTSCVILVLRVIFLVKLVLTSFRRYDYLIV